MTFKEWANKSQYTQVELANILGVSQTAVSSWKCGDKMPRKATRSKIEKLAGFPIEWDGVTGCDFADVFSTIRKTYAFVDDEEKSRFLYFVEIYMNGETITDRGAKSAYLGFLAVKPYIEPYRKKAAE